MFVETKWDEMFFPETHKRKLPRLVVEPEFYIE